MSIALADTRKFTISRTGLEVHDHLSFEEWSSLAPLLNEAARGVAFVIGDWLIYGFDRFGRTEEAANKPGARVRSEDYEAAIRHTGLDRATLHTYAHVSRKVPPLLRNKDLSWEHHKIVAKLPPVDQQLWLRLASDQLAKGRPVSTRRLRRSISAGRLVEERGEGRPFLEGEMVVNLQSGAADGELAAVGEGDAHAWVCGVKFGS